MPHDHAHPPADLGDRRVAAAVAVNLALTVVQIVAGVLSGSLALVADAVHNLSDALSLVLAFVARRIARRPADATMPFGYGRAEVVAALVNYTALVVLAIWLIVEGVGRLADPPEIAGWTVIIVAAIALVIDLATAALIYSLSHGSANMRAAFLHNAMDAAGSLAVIVSGFGVLLYDWRLLDPLLTLAIAGWILWQAVVEIRPVIRILMLGSPPQPAAEAVRIALSDQPGVTEIHYLHLWQLSEHEVALDAHVVIDPGAEAIAVKRRLKIVLAEEYGIGRAVLELETEADRCDSPQAIGSTRPVIPRAS